MKKKSKWVAGPESEDSCEMCGWGDWGHMCGSLKYLTPPPSSFSFLFFLNWAGCVTKGVGLALVAEENRKEKKKRKEKKRKGKWVGLGVGQGVNKYIKRIRYIWVTSHYNIVKIYYENVVNITLSEKRNIKAKYFFTKFFIKRVIYY